MEEVKVAIVGEGPTGLMAVAKCIYLAATMPSPSKKFSLTWFIGRPTYVRRHVINISKSFLLELESVLQNCVACISGGIEDNTHDMIEMSIRTLESIMFQKIDASISDLEKGKGGAAMKDFTVTKAGKFNYTEDVSRFHHVFFCDGAWSGGRNKVHFSEKKPFDVISFRYSNPIVILYSGLGPSVINDTWKPSNNMHSKKVYINDRIAGEFGLDLQIMYDILAIFYNIRKNIDVGPRTPRRDLWATGYQDFDEMVSILKELGHVLITILNEKGIYNFIEELRTVGAFISESETQLLRDIIDKKIVIEDILHRIFSIVDANTELKTNIILSPVLPKIATNGIALGNGNEPTLRYAIQKGDTSCYLLGDSANAFPPGYSLEISLQSCNHVIEVFYTTFFTDKVIQFNTLEYRTLECPVKDLYTKGAFWGGYPKDDIAGNHTPKTLEELEKRVIHQYKKIPEESTFIRAYNIYEFQLFIWHAKKLLCIGKFQLGGKSRRVRMVRKVRKVRKTRRARSKNNLYKRLE